MHKIQMRGQIAVGGLLIMLLAAGCFQSAGDSLQVTSVAQGVATFTPIPLETDTPVADEQAATATATPDIEVIASATVPDFLASATPESVGSVLGQDSGDLQGQVIEDTDLTATAIIERSTAQAALRLTETAAALATEVIPTLPPPIVTATPLDQGGGGALNPPVFVQPGADCVHIVQPGDRNLWRISLRYGVTVHDIAAASGIANIQLIYIGQELIIPGCGTGQYPPQNPPNVNCNPNGPVHIVRQNENLFRISLQYNVSVAALVACNGIANKNLIYIDQQIVIPS